MSVGLGNVAMEIAVREARAQGLDVKLVEFSDYISQNEGVNDGSLDANYYQHLPYLESMIAAKGYKLVPIALGYTSRMAIYSRSTARWPSCPRARPSPTPMIPSIPAMPC